MTLTIILAECGLELIPRSIRRYPAVRRTLSTKNYSSQLLDNALHHSAMNSLKNKMKRGRPDILHLCLLNALGSPLNKSGKLNLFFHTNNDRIFKVNPNIRIAKNFNRFKGLMAKLLIDNKIEIDEIPLINPVNKNLNELISEYKNPKTLVLSRKGKLIRSYKDLFKFDPSINYILIIGAFQKSTFSKRILNISDNLISVSKNSLHSWIVVNKAITYYEIINNIL